MFDPHERYISKLLCIGFSRKVSFSNQGLAVQCEDRRIGRVLSHNLMLDHAVSLRTAAAAVVVIVDASGEA